MLHLHFRAIPSVEVDLIRAPASTVEGNRLAYLQDHDHCHRTFTGIARGALLNDLTSGAIGNYADSATEPTRAPDEEQTSVGVVFARDHEDRTLLLGLDNLEASLGERGQRSLQLRTTPRLGDFRLFGGVEVDLGFFSLGLLDTAVEGGPICLHSVSDHRDDVLHWEKRAIVFVTTV